MVTFGIFLLFYPGRVDETDMVSDNWVSSIGGLGAIFTALIPTAFCAVSDQPIVIGEILNHFCDDEGLTIQYVHNIKILGIIHLSCAAIFLRV